LRAKFHSRLKEEDRITKPLHSDKVGGLDQERSPVIGAISLLKKIKL